MARFRFILIGWMFCVLLSGCGVIEIYSPEENNPIPVVESPTSIVEMVPETPPVSITETRIPETAAPVMATETTTTYSDPVPTPTISPTATPLPYRYVLQAGTPVRLANFRYPELGCGWMGLGGQVFGLDEQAQQLVVIKVSGLLGGVEQMHLALTGLAPVFGPGGYEIKLADQPVESSGSLNIQLFDLDGVPISDLYYFDTVGGELGCEQNLVLINFNQTVVDLDNRSYLPLIGKEGMPTGSTP